MRIIITEEEREFLEEIVTIARDIASLEFQDQPEQVQLATNLLRKLRKKDEKQETEK